MHSIYMFQYTRSLTTAKCNLETSIYTEVPSYLQQIATSLSKNGTNQTKNK